MSTGPPASDQLIFQFLFRYLCKINSRIWFGPVNTNFHFEDCYISEQLNKDLEIFDTKNINLYFSLLGGFCWGGFYDDFRFVLDQQAE